MPKKDRNRNRRSWWLKKYRQESILSRAQPVGPFPFVLVLDHLKAGFNVGKILRSASAFGACEVHLVGMEEFDPSPAKGAFRQTRTVPLAALSESFTQLQAEGYTIFALAADGDQVLGECELPERSAFVLGHEEFGLSLDPAQQSQVRRLSIRQFGQVESLNVSVAASLACYEYLRQRQFKAPPAWTVRREEELRQHREREAARDLLPEVIPLP